MCAVLAFPQRQENVFAGANRAVPPEQVLAWELEGLTQEEIRDELNSRGLTEYAEQPLPNALSASGADAETIRVVHHTKAPKNYWKLGLRLPGPTDYLYELAGAILWGLGDALLTVQNEEGKQPHTPPNGARGTLGKYKKPVIF